MMSARAFNQRPAIHVETLTAPSQNFTLFGDPCRLPRVQQKVQRIEYKLEILLLPICRDSVSLSPFDIQSIIYDQHVLNTDEYCEI